MCPLRIILIFLSATLAGFFLLRNIKSSVTADEGDIRSGDGCNDKTTTLFSRAKGGIESGFWMLVDMASGKYLWNHLVSSASPSKKSKKLE